MQPVITLTQNALKDFLLGVALRRPVFIWGPPGIGKTAIVESFADDLGMECISLPGSQLAPEDVIGSPKIDIERGVTRFFPPSNIKRDKPFLLFLDELNACSHDVQKAFYSLIHEQRVGEYNLPAGSIVIAAGNRSQDSSIVKPLSAALLNRAVHVHLAVSPREWLDWAGGASIHASVIEYIQTRPTQLLSKPSKLQEPFSSPRSWHMLSDCLSGFGDGITQEQVAAASFGCLTREHAVDFGAYLKMVKNKYGLAAIIRGDASWPRKPDERDILYFLAMSFRSQLVKTLPRENVVAGSDAKNLAHRAKALIIELSGINFEFAQMVMARDEAEGETMPAWFMAEVIRDLPRLLDKKDM